MKEETTGITDGQIDGVRRARPRPRRLSQLFAQMAENAQDRVSVAMIRDSLGDRSFAALLVVFAALNLIPLPPPSSAVLGLPLVIVAAQMLYGSKRVWLPNFLMEKSLSAEQFRALMSRLVPRLMQMERWVRPRYWPFWRRRGERVVGGMALLLGIVVTLPIPLGNWLPAFSTALLGLALSERDGVLLLIGGLVAAASMAVIVAVIGAAGALTHILYGWML